MISYQNMGLVLLIPSTIFGIIVMGMQWTLTPIPFPIPSNQISIMNFGVWIVGIVLLLKGIGVDQKKESNEKKRRTEEQIKFEKQEYEKKLNQDEEIQKLKDKVEELEKNKERKE
jgi:hypothetical protein